METVAEIERQVLLYEGLLRLSLFGLVFMLMMVWERWSPRRKLSISRRLRWAGNLGLMVLNNLILRLLFPAAAVGIAVSVQKLEWGLFNALPLPFWVEVVLAVLLLDLAIYLQHLLMHRLPVLWRLHRVHHADLDIDLTTGLRFHSLEILFSMLLKALVIALLGPALLAVLIFETLLNTMAMFNHANVRLPAVLDRSLRMLLVTPDMHRVHHSVVVTETNSNYGFNLSLWDRLFKTYIDQPGAGHQAMTIGLADFRDQNQVERLPGMLAMPFVIRP